MSGRYLFRKPTGRPGYRGASPPRYRRETGPYGKHAGGEYDSHLLVPAAQPG